MLFGTRILCRAERTPYSVNITMQLNILHFLRLYFTLALAGRFGIRARTAQEARSSFKAINVLCIRAKELALRVQSLDETMSWCWGSDVYGLFELRDEGVEYGGRCWVTEKGCVKEISAFQNDIWILLLDQCIEAVRGTEVL